MRTITKEQAVALDAASVWLRNREEWENGHRIGLYRGFIVGFAMACFAWATWSLW
jgi:hypothetical protein